MGTADGVHETGNINYVISGSPEHEQMKQERSDAPSPSAPEVSACGEQPSWETGLVSLLLIAGCLAGAGWLWRDTTGLLWGGGIGLAVGSVVFLLSWLRSVEVVVVPSVLALLAGAGGLVAWIFWGSSAVPYGMIAATIGVAGLVMLILAIIEDRAVLGVVLRIAFVVGALLTLPRLIGTLFGS